MQSSRKSNLGALKNAVGPRKEENDIQSPDVV